MYSSRGIFYSKETQWTCLFYIIGILASIIIIILASITVWFLTMIGITLEERFCWCFVFLQFILSARESYHTFPISTNTSYEMILKSSSLWSLGCIGNEMKPYMGEWTVSMGEYWRGSIVIPVNSKSGEMKEAEVPGAREEFWEGTEWSSTYSNVCLAHKKHWINIWWLQERLFQFKLPHIHLFIQQ